MPGYVHFDQKMLFRFRSIFLAIFFISLNKNSITKANPHINMLVTFNQIGVPILSARRVYSTVEKECPRKVFKGIKLIMEKQQQQKKNQLIILYEMRIVMHGYNY